MKKIAIIISYAYIGTPKILPGSIIDLYISYKYFTENDFDVYAITDFNKDHYPGLNTVIRTALRKKTVQNDIYDLWDKKNILFETNIINGILQILNNVSADKICLYFSGHTFKKEIYITDKKKIPTSLVTDIINIKDQVWIFDSCYCDILLKYKFDGKNLVVHSTNFERSEKKDNIVAIVSSETDERSYSTNIGSLFTRYFFTLLKKHNIKNVEYVSEYITSTISNKNEGYNQNVCFFSSKPMLIASLPEWL